MKRILWLGLGLLCGPSEASAQEDVIVIIDSSETSTLSSTSTDTSSVVNPLADDEEIVIVGPEDPLSSSATDLSPFDIQARVALTWQVQGAADLRHDRDQELIAELTTSARIRLDIDVSPHLSVFVEPELRWMTGWDRDGTNRAVLVSNSPEAVVAWGSANVLVQGGLMEFGWGGSDLVRPNDVLNPEDYRAGLLGFDESRKIPVLAAALTYGAGPLTFKGVWIPFAEAHRFLLTGWDFAVGQGVMSSPLTALSNVEGVNLGFVDRFGESLLQTDRPADDWEQATLGLRMTWSSGNFDGSAQAVYGWDPLPYVTADPNLQFLVANFAEAQQFNRLPDLNDSDVVRALTGLQEALEQNRAILSGKLIRRSQVGMDAVYAWDPVVLKVDLSYTFQSVLYTQSGQPRIYPTLRAVFGMEYYEGEAFQLSAELFALSVFDVEDNTRLNFFGSGTSTMIPGAATWIRYALFNQDLWFEFGALVTFGSPDVVLVPSTTYRPMMGHEITLGGYYLNGGSGGFGSAYAHNDQLWLRYRLSY